MNLRESAAHLQISKIQSVSSPLTERHHLSVTKGGECHVNIGCFEGKQNEEEGVR
ncbi:hypothetical protein CHCC14820_3936 [Bacillus paralicheniformis]|uniref:Uncharacterized protein n=1 Tax=Bacillus paralicheniformis TaxID=1648923 RepID=A0A6I7U1C5_9BACI|nr:hypothetical protein SC10_B2orf02849 [Bacillus paralicheniformis]OLF87750.1 hypothetical protein B4121_4202 [Bacillus paralicheniformis]OLG07245.1 hypothetical protein B4125_1426 [Bacillus paralicheniformis]OLG11901.1 hypothetical protein B4123_1620 [Bacillus paralicheniformis]OLG13501.1 hypothetical protein B4123_0004 [Bacillus paralicheniformis]